MNKHSELEIFKLCERLAKLLGAEEAIADLKKLYTTHQEMFQNITAGGRAKMLYIWVRSKTKETKYHM